MPVRTIKAIYDTTDGVVHDPYGDGLEAIEEFVAWLNAKTRSKRGADKDDRFMVVTVTPFRPTARGGMARHYAEYLKGAPEVRIRAAMRHVIDESHRRREYRASIVQQDGGWTVPQATATIQTIAQIANVPFADAHAAFFAYLKDQLGDVMDRVAFPPVDAVRPETHAADRFGGESYPVDL